MANYVIKRRAHIVDMACPNRQTFCIRECNNSIRGCALCEPYAYGRDKRGNIPPNFPMPAISLRHEYTKHGVWVYENYTKTEWICIRAFCLMTDGTVKCYTQ